MLITHLGHSTVLVETGQTRILIDPGNFSTAWHDLEDLDVIVVTHAHPDHIDPQWVPALLERNPAARFLVEPGATLGLQRAEAFPPGASLRIGQTSLAAVGGLHAVIHRDIPRIGNIGLVVRPAGEPHFFHPGDCLDTVPAGIDILAAAAHGPWCAMKEIIDFIRAVGAAQGFLIHDGLVNERGWNLSFSRFNELTSTHFTDLRDTGPWQP